MDVNRAKPSQKSRCSFGIFEEEPMRNAVPDTQPASRHLDLYVSAKGNDGWSGRQAAPNAEGTDGPFATITRARDAVRRLKQAAKLPASITVWLRGGRYFLSEPLLFGPEDSAPVTYAAYPGEEPILDGGTRIEGWRAETVGGVSMWVADVPEVAEGKWYFRQLFVNGERRERPRLPKKGLYRVADFPGSTRPGRIFAGSDTFQCAPGHIRNWKNLTDVEVVAFHWWIEERMPILSFDERTNTVKSSRRTRMELRDDVAAGFARYYVENVFEALTEPGEWYLDRPTGKLYYIPLPGESLETAEVFAPRIEQFLRVVGKPDEGAYVEFLRFEGLTFQHTEWRQPGERERRVPVDFAQQPVAEYASSPQAAHMVPGVIYLEAARSCAIEECTIEHIGGYGVELADGCIADRVIGNTIADMGAGGVKLNGSKADGPASRRTGNNRITDNVIEHGGRVFQSAVGILSMHSFGNELSHNHIHDLYYTGISCGWVWGYGENVSKNNRIEKNHIHDLGHGLLSDMGGIYTLGVQPGTMLRGNLIHDVEKSNYGGWAIYMDEGSSHIISEHNICYQTSSQGFHQHYGRENVVRNNIFAFGREGQATVSRYEEHLSTSFERNLFIADGQPIFAGGRLETPIYLSNVNLFWDVSGREVICANARRDEKGEWVIVKAFSIEEWRKLGYDLQSVIADPRCRNAKQFDFALAEDSPAFALGFKAIDMSDVGPRPKGEREE